MLDKSYQGCDSTKGLHHSLGKMPNGAQVLEPCPCFYQEQFQKSISNEDQYVCL